MKQCLMVFQTNFEPMNKQSYSFYLYCCTVHLVDSIIITKPTNALIVCALVRISAFVGFVIIIEFYSLPNNKSTPGYTVQCVLSYVEVNDPNDNWY